MTTLDTLKRKYLTAKDAYYNDERPILTDAEFDRLEDKIKRLDPHWSELKKTGVTVKNKKVAVALARFMPSLSKAYPEAVGKWLDKNPSHKYVVLDKLDGSSLQLLYVDGALRMVATRGDGTDGGNITFLAPHLKIPQTIQGKGAVILRCEAVIPKLRFKKWAAEFDHPRNMVNGLLNRRTPHAALRDVDIVVLGVYGTRLLTGLDYAEHEGFDVVNYRLMDLAEDAPTKLSGWLARQTNKGVYDIDGLVLAPTSFEFDYKSADKPKQTIAFKVNTDEASVEAEVKSVVWQISGRERIIPKIEIKPIQIGGVTVTYCTSHNAVWMMDRKIGPGAVVKLVRSGGVIPKIVEVKKPARRMQLPEVPYKVQGVHFVVTKASDHTRKTVQIKNTLKFMQTMGVEFIAEKTISLVCSQQLATPTHYLASWYKGTLAKTLVRAGVGQVMAEKIHQEFDRVFNQPVSVLKLMVASQAFGAGIGERKLQQLVDAGLSLTRLALANDTEIERIVADVRGFSDKTINLLIDGFAAWRVFYQGIGPYVTCVDERKAKPKPAKGKWSAHRVSFTGYRDKAQEAEVEAGGGTVVPFGSKTTVLFIKDGGKASSKVAKAKAARITLAYFDKFKP